MRTEKYFILLWLVDFFDLDLLCKTPLESLEIPVTNFVESGDVG